MMSFTADIYNKIFQDIMTANKGIPIVGSRMTTCDSGVKMVYSVDVVSKMRAAYISIPLEKPDVKFPHWKGVEIEIVSLPAYSNNLFFIELKQLPNSASDIFEIVVEDIRVNMNKIGSIGESVQRTLHVLAKWKNFFDTERQIVLSQERQQGLYGELLFLEESISNYGIDAVIHWAGSNSEPHDFYFGANAVEVKTTKTNAPYYATISNEYQLDESDLTGKIYLKIYILRESQSSGEKLNSIIDRIRNILNENRIMLEKFNKKLQQYGYFDEVKDNYTAGYYIRDNYCFEVGDNFPRIVRKLLPEGVAEVSYKISITQCLPFIVEMDKVFQVLKGEYTNVD